MRRRLTASLVAVGVTSALTLTACTGSAPAKPRPTPSATTAPAVSWRPDQTIAGLLPTAVTTDPKTGFVYVGGATKAGRTASYSGPLIKGGALQPALWLRRSDGSWHLGHLKVTSFYGAQATLSSVAADLTVVALGAVAGGAHANPRPSFFRGAQAHLTEEEQNFYVWGGENAVGIVSMAISDAERPLMVGQWAPDGHRASGALWTSGYSDTYVRHDAIPGLADSKGGKRTTSPLAAAGAAGGYAIVGSVTDLTKPGLSIVPAVWTSADGTAVTLGTLPAPPGTFGGPTDIACRDRRTINDPSLPGTCITAGLLTAGGVPRLAAWRVVVGPTATGQLIDTRACEPPPAAPDPGAEAARAPTVRVSLDRSGTGWVVASTSRAGVVCRVVGLVARPVATPPGCTPIAVGTPAPDQAELVCADGQGVSTYRQG
jgi:hypothetical protein